MTGNELAAHVQIGIIDLEEMLDEASIPERAASADTYLVDLYDGGWQRDRFDEALSDIDAAATEVQSRFSKLVQDCVDYEGDTAFDTDALDDLATRIADVRELVERKRGESMESMFALETAFESFVEDVSKWLADQRKGLSAEYDHYADGADACERKLSQIRADVEELMRR